MWTHPFNDGGEGGRVSYERYRFMCVTYLLALVNITSLTNSIARPQLTSSLKYITSFHHHVVVEMVIVATMSTSAAGAMKGSVVGQSKVAGEFQSRGIELCHLC